MTNYNEMTGAELLNVYNSLVPDEAKRLHVWKHAKAELIERIEALTPAPTEQRKHKKPSKSMQMLMVLANQNEAPLEELVEKLNTSEGSVRSYISYFKTGKKGHPKVDMACEGGTVFLKDFDAADKALEAVMFKPC